MAIRETKKRIFYNWKSASSRRSVREGPGARGDAVPDSATEIVEGVAPPAPDPPAQQHVVYRGRASV